MTTATDIPTPRPAPIDPKNEKRARTAGALYLITFVTSIPTLRLYEPILGNPDFVLGAGGSDSVLWGAFLEVVLAFACIGTAVMLFPLARRQSETAAVGFVGARVVEAGLILVGVVSLLSVVTLRDDGVGVGAGDEFSLVTAGRALVAVHDWTFLLGQSLMPVVNALCLGYALFRSGLVPRIIPVVGLAGAPLLLASDIAIFWGVYAQDTAPAALAALPIAVWEFTLGLWLLVKGVRDPRLRPARVRPSSGSDGTAECDDGPTGPPMPRPTGYTS